ncbi:SAM-dependent methyltransferase [Magnaporthiopsis poae ATCC 64411]|uniref:SAM-dependent methyltransferase n=1 Tax=Magnaporthiopsis poae (strain ATCC 64411 / 73-15) TaxID=644358 RepID=A0A0C4DN67_MAGP6|nr:SAM-dependent methyltransferase [Magnaporthiopsis poae ATCC 64411]
MADETPAGILIPVSHVPQLAAYSPLPPDPTPPPLPSHPTASTTATCTSTQSLEIGRDQGDYTTVLASAAGSHHGSVSAIDPAPPTYGASFTLADAQACHLGVPKVGSRITWHNSTSLDQLLLAATTTSPSAS